MSAKNSIPKSQQKHVIILGAGASFSSGYPLANRLRLLMTSEREARKALPNPTTAELNKAFAPMFNGTTGKIDRLFREGVFATVDEFSYLAGPRFNGEVQALKRRLRFALALHNPEDHAEQSDYYPFVQRLFRGGIFPLRDDISILTFNYDPYLAFLLSRAVRVRFEAAGRLNDDGKVILAECLHSVTSGFCGSSKAIKYGDGLCLLHLHGMIALPERVEGTRAICFDDLFGSNLKARLEKLHANTAPPIAFPWEVIAQNRIHSKDDFGLRLDAEDGIPFDVRELFVAIWERAQREINDAHKISFVGLSMHEFLNPAFRFLFQGKKRSARIVVANKEMERFRETDRGINNPRSPIFKIKRLLHDVWPWVNDSGESVDPTTHETFEEFIKNEMDEG